MRENAAPVGNSAGNVSAAATKRIAWVDYAKAVAILGVFVMHSAAPGSLSAVVSAYDMMVFFLLSGFVFSIRRYASFRPFLWNKVRTLLIPGLFLSVVPFLIERLISVALGGERWSLGGGYLKWFAGYAINLRGREGFGSIPWFLVCLFVIEIGGYVLLRAVTSLGLDGGRRFVALILVSAVLLAVGWLYGAFVHVVLPWCGDVALSMSGFFVVGLALRPYADRLHRALRSWSIVPACALLIAAVWLDSRVFQGAVNPYMNDLGNPLCFVIGALAGIWMVFALCRTIADCKPLDRVLGGLLAYWGRNTLVFYCINAPIYPRLIPWLLGVVGLDTTSTDVRVQLVCTLGAILINLAICTPCAEIMNRWLPGVLGRKRR